MTVPSLAAEWSIVPWMSTKAYYNDNLLLTPLPHDPTYGYWISPGVEFSGKTERLEVSGKAALDFVDYYGGEPSRFTNVFLPLTMKYRTERDEWAFTGGFTRDNTLMGELLTTGVVLRFTQRNLWTISPTWTRMVTDKLSVQSSLQFNDASYQDGLRLGLLDYQLYGGSAGFLYHLTERDDMQLAGTYTNFRTINGSFGLRAHYPGAMLSFTHIFTEDIKTTIYGGPKFLSSTSQSGGITQSSRDTIWVYGMGLTKEFENSSIQFTIGREIFPLGVGLLVQTDRIGMLASYTLSESVMASFDASGYFVTGATSLAGGSLFPNSNLLYLTPKLTWKFSERWKLDASYTYGWRDGETLADPTMSNAMVLMLTYYPLKISVGN